MGSEFVTDPPHKAYGKAKRAPFRLRLSYQTMGLGVASIEVLSIVAASVLGAIFYQMGWLGEPSNPKVGIGIGCLAALIHVSFARAADLYRLAVILEPVRHLARLCIVWGSSLLVLTAMLFLLKEGSSLSRGTFIFFSFLEFVFLWTIRLAASKTISSMIVRGAIAGRSAVVIGHGIELNHLNAASLLHQFGFEEVARVVLDGFAEDQDMARKQALQSAIALGRETHAEEFVVAVSWSESALIADINEALRNSPLPVRLLPDWCVRATLEDRRADLSLGASITVEMQRAPMALAERTAKRAIDISLASMAIIILSPIFVCAALAIKLDSRGPIIFKQRRNGFDEHLFTIFKFRTMRVLEDGDTVVQAQRRDPRVTRVGAMLRHTSIDELPQLFNVLRGDMSLVGPRPHAVTHDNQYKRLIETYCCRHHVKPGITGWAQVNGLRGETSRLELMQKRVELDIWYINNWSLGLDFQIMLRTCFELLKHDAY